MMTPEQADDDWTENGRGPSHGKPEALPHRDPLRHWPAWKRAALERAEAQIARAFQKVNP